MNKLDYRSDSLVSSMCRELDYIKFRSQSIRNSLYNCQNKLLVIRLRNELINLNNRKESIRKLSLIIKQNSSQNTLSIDLLVEMIRRTLIFS